MGLAEGLLGVERSYPIVPGGSSGTLVGYCVDAVSLTADVLKSERTSSTSSLGRAAHFSRCGRRASRTFDPIIESRRLLTPTSMCAYTVVEQNSVGHP